MVNICSDADLQLAIVACTISKVISEAAFVNVFSSSYTNVDESYILYSTAIVTVYN